MMFGISWSELLVIAGLGLIVIGPRDFPSVVHQIGVALGTFKRFIESYRAQFYEALEQSSAESPSLPSYPSSENPYLLAQIAHQGSAPLYESSQESSSRLTSHPSSEDSYLLAQIEAQDLAPPSLVPQDPPRL
jgi:sec-independent protein translocase protein TatB